MLMRPPLARLMFLLGAALPFPWATAFAHDFWIRPSAFNAGIDAPIDFSLEIGHLGESERYGRNPARIERFVIAGPGAEGPERDVPGTPGADPAGQTVLLGEGVYVVGYRSNHARSELPAAKFETYLREEGLEEVADARADSGESAKPGIEAYSRCAKSLVRAQGEAGRAAPDPAGAQRALGFTLELIPVGDPTAAKVGQRVTFRLLHEGEPYAGAKVDFAVEHDHGSEDSHAHEHESMRTNASGEVSFVVDQPGLWVVNCVVMERAAEGLNADWESWWASLTFGVRE